MAVSRPSWLHSGVRSAKVERWSSVFGTAGLGVVFGMVMGAIAMAPATAQADGQPRDGTTEISRMQTLNREVLMRTGVCVGCNLRGNDFTGQSLFNAQLQGADLREALLIRVNLRGADLREVDLSGAFLWGSDLTGALLEGARLCGTVMPSGARLDIGCLPPRPVNTVQRTAWGSAAIPVGYLGGWADGPAGQVRLVGQQRAARAVPAVTGQVVVPAEAVPAGEQERAQVVMSADGLRGRARGLLETDGRDVWSIELVPGWMEVRLIGNFLRSRLEILDENEAVVATGGNTLNWQVPTEGHYFITVQGWRPERPYELAVAINPRSPQASPATPTSAPPASSFEPIPRPQAKPETDPTLEVNESEGEVEETMGPIDPRVTMPVDPVEPRALSLEIETGEGLAEGVVKEGQMATWLVTSRPGELELDIESEDDGARFSVRDPQGRIVARQVREAEIFVPRDGIYQIQVEARQELAEYSLTVQLK